MDSRTREWKRKLQHSIASTYSYEYVLGEIGSYFHMASKAITKIESGGDPSIAFIAAKKRRTDHTYAARGSL